MINSAGRTANYEGLNLAAAGIETDAKRIVFDKYLRCVPNRDIFVAGDAVPSPPQLSPIAT
ncbi:MAG TPA: FAD-dependent oxidoreductase, partial [Deltaproteobacteria bacterium]|nr:FAD-dependent oxidoreductase [Deltaproteobacteria bacterium]